MMGRERWRWNLVICWLRLFSRGVGWWALGSGGFFLWKADDTEDCSCSWLRGTKMYIVECIFTILCPKTSRFKVVHPHCLLYLPKPSFQLTYSINNIWSYTRRDISLLLPPAISKPRVFRHPCSYSLHIWQDQLSLTDGEAANSDGVLVPKANSTLRKSHSFIPYPFYRPRSLAPTLTLLQMQCPQVSPDLQRFPSE